MCYCDEVLKFLLAARSRLDWENNHVDSTLMSILLVYLHGKLGDAMSNQMQMTKAMGQSYSIEWWNKKGLNNPPDINPKDFITKKVEWRYDKGMPSVFDSQVVFGDSSTALNSIVQRAHRNDIRFSLLFTSPPYCAVTDYHADQWLRLWLLGGPEVPQASSEKHKGRFASKQGYIELLDSVFSQCSELMAENSTVYVRTDSRAFTFNATREVLKNHFPDHDMQVTNKPFIKKTQTELFGNSSLENGEIDIVLRR